MSCAPIETSWLLFPRSRRRKLLQPSRCPKPFLFRDNRLWSGEASVSSLTKRPPAENLRGKNREGLSPASRPPITDTLERGASAAELLEPARDPAATGPREELDPEMLCYPRGPRETRSPLLLLLWTFFCLKKKEKKRGNYKKQGTEQGLIMPDQITVTEFVVETNEDYKSPTASNFTTRMSHCRNTVTALEEVSTFGGAVDCYLHDKDYVRISWAVLFIIFYINVSVFLSWGGVTSNILCTIPRDLLFSCLGLLLCHYTVALWFLLHPQWSVIIG